MNCKRWWNNNSHTLKGVIGLFYLLFLSFSLAWSGNFIPDPWTLEKSQYRGRFLMGVNQIPTEGKVRFPAVGQFELGFFDKTHLDVIYGEEISLGIQNTLSREDEWYPQLSFGMRSILSSSEKTWFGNKEEDLKGEFYIVLGKSMGEWGRMWGGYSYFSRAQRTDQGFWGFKVMAPAAMGLSYEGFSRLGEIHHQLGIEWNPLPNLQVKGGLLEVQEWLYQEGSLGLYSKAENERADAYLWPGYYFGVEMQSVLWGEQSGSPVERLQKVEEEVALLRQQNLILQARLNRSEKAMAKWVGPSIEIREQKEVEALENIDTLVQMVLRGEPAADIKKKQDELMVLREPAEKVLVKLIDNATTEKEYKLVSIRVMGSWRQKIFVSPLIAMLPSHESILRREALIALGQINDLGSAEAIGKLRNDPEELVRLVAEQIYNRMKKEISERAQGEQMKSLKSEKMKDPLEDPPEMTTEAPVEDNGNEMNAPDKIEEPLPAPRMPM